MSELNKESVEQAGGDERAAFEQWLEQHMSHHFSPEFDLAKYEDSGEYRYNPAADYWKAWQARAALAQPSPAPELERPEVVAFRYHCTNAEGEPLPGWFYSDDAGTLGLREPLMTVAQHERIVEARWNRAMDLLLDHVSRISEKFKAERDAALARVAELTATRNRYGVDTHYFNKNLQRILRDFESFTPDELARSLIILAKVADEKVVAQAQHSVPAAWYYDAPSQAEAAIIDIRGMWGEDDCPTYEDVASALRRLLAAEPVCRLSRSALTDAQMRRLYDSSTETENERLGFAAFARLIRRAEAVHQIAAAPGKEGV